MNHYVANLCLLDKVHVCVCVRACVCSLCTYSCWVVCQGLCDYVWMLGVCLNLVFLETIE